MTRIRHPFVVLAVLAAATVQARTADPAPATPAPPADPPIAIARDASTLTWLPCPAFLPAGCQIAVLHGNPAKPNVDVFFKVPGGAHIPAHWHTSAERMVLVSGKLAVTYAGQPSATLTPGMYAYGPAKVSHEADCAAGADCVLFIALEGPLDVFATEDGAPPADANAADPKSRPN
jgi:quercetin dioxygenase-like cupin family protein